MHDIYILCAIRCNHHTNNTTGKSTLAKFLSDDVSALDSELIVKHGYVGMERGYLSAYITPLIYLSYDAGMTAHDVITQASSSDRSDRDTSGDTNDAYRLAVLSRISHLLHLPLHTQVGSMLESQKKAFEILLACSRSLLSNNSTYSSSNSPSNRQPRKTKILLLLDEYFDKEAPAVTKVVFGMIYGLIKHATGNKGSRESKDHGNYNLDIQIQAVVVSHSRNVVNQAQWVVCLNDGEVSALVLRLERPYLYTLVVLFNT